jgi:hypothetical protein
MEQALRRNFEVGGHKAWWLARLGRLFDVHFVSTLPPDFVSRFQFNPVDVSQSGERLRSLVERAGPSARIGVLPYSGCTLPFVMEHVQS